MEQIIASHTDNISIRYPYSVEDEERLLRIIAASKDGNGANVKWNSVLYEYNSGVNPQFKRSRIALKSKYRKLDHNNPVTMAAEAASTPMDGAVAELHVASEYPYPHLIVADKGGRFSAEETAILAAVVSQLGGRINWGKAAREYNSKCNELLRLKPYADVKQRTKEMLKSKKKSF